MLVFLTGGASRVDVQSLLILRPVSAFICVVALISLRREHLEGRKGLLAGIGVMLALAAIHLIPLPPEIWRSLPGRQELVRIDALAELGDVWRPLTLAPMNGWHALSSLLAPLAVVLLGIQLSRDDLYRLLPLLIALGAISGLFGLLQALEALRVRYTSIESPIMVPLSACLPTAITPLFCSPVFFHCCPFLLQQAPEQQTSSEADSWSPPRSPSSWFRSFS